MSKATGTIRKMVKRLMTAWLIPGAGLLWTNGAHATVCLGKFLLDLPDDVEIALPTHDYMIWTNPGANWNNHANYVFIDEAKTPGKMGIEDRERSRETQATYSTQYIGGKELISGREMSRQEFAKFKVQAYTQTRETILLSGGEADYRMQQLDFKEHAGTDSFAIFNRLYLWRGGRIFAWPYREWEDAETAQWVAFVDKNLSARRMDEIPAKNGVCLNMGFIEDGDLALTPRKVAVTFRWKSHPEVEIFFSDKSVGAGRMQTDASSGLKDFWMSYYDGALKRPYLLYDQKQRGAGFPEHMLGGIPGRESRVEINYQDGKIDYGYVVYAAGEVKDKPDRSDLMLYVIRNASRAKGTPMGKDEFMAFADKIAASVRRRVVPPAAELRGKNE